MKEARKKKTNIKHQTKQNIKIKNKHKTSFMEVLQDAREFSRKGFLGHVFNTSEESTAEMMNVSQYAALAVIPVVILNKMVQRFIPEADPDKSSLEILVEILIQLVAMFLGILLIHRMITYVPTYSGFKYEHLTLTNVVLAFLVIVLSIQTKLGLKVNILFDRISELWNGNDESGNRRNNVRNKVRFSEAMTAHIPSQADHLDHGGYQDSVFPPAPIASTRPSNGTYDTMMRGNPGAGGSAPGPMAANAVLGGSGFGSSFF